MSILYLLLDVVELRGAGSRADTTRTFILLMVPIGSKVYSHLTTLCPEQNKDVFIDLSVTETGQTQCCVCICKHTESPIFDMTIVVVAAVTTAVCGTEASLLPPVGTQAP